MNSLRTWEVGADISWLPLSATTMDLQSFRNFQPTKVSVLVTLLLPLLIQLSLASLPIPAYSVKKDFWFKISKILSYLCSSLSAACAVFFWFWRYRLIRSMNIANLFKEKSPPDNWEASIFMLSVTTCQNLPQPTVVARWPIPGLKLHKLKWQSTLLCWICLLLLR